MPVIYGGVSIRPAPQVSLSKSYASMGDGRKVGTTITARLSGTITAEKTNDTYTPLPIDNRLSTLLTKQSTFRGYFAQDGLLFEIQGYDSVPPVTFPAIIDSIDFAEGPWTDKSDYTVTLHGNTITSEDVGFPNCESASESWTFEEGDLPRSWKAAHSVAARGKIIYDGNGVITTPAWQNAKTFVQNTLGLDWTTTTTFSPSSGSALAGTSAVAPPTTNQWDRRVNETIDEAEGTYSVTETFTLSANGYIENFTTTIKRVDEPNITTTASISGTIHGLRKTLNDPEERYTNALAQWNTVSDLLVSRCQSYVSSIGGGTLNTHPTAFSVDHDEFNGLINYQAEFDDRVYVNDTYEVYDVSQSVGDEDYKTTVKVEGTITGALYLDDVPSTTIKFTRANTQWGLVEGLIFARAIAATGNNNLKPFPVTAQVTPNHAQGTVSYVYEFTDQTPISVKHDYTVTAKTSREDGTDTVTIEGTITGLRTANSGQPFGSGDQLERYNNALTYWSGISTNLLGVASQYVDFTCINPNPLINQTGYNPYNGVINYNAEFSSTIIPLTPGALSEVVTVQNQTAVEVIATIPVLDKASGPVIQDMNTITENRTTVTFEVVMYPPKYNCTPTISPPTVDITPYIPSGSVVFKTEDTNNWIAKTGRYYRTVSWVWEA